MGSNDITDEIFRAIRDEIRATNALLDRMGEALNHRIDATNDRLDGMNQRIDETHRRIEQSDRHVVESGLRAATSITELAGLVHELANILRSPHDLCSRVEEWESEFEALKKRIACRSPRALR